MQDPNTSNQGDLIFKLDQDRAWLLENLDKGLSLIHISEPTRRP